MPVIELRQYRLHPGTRDTLVDLFDAHFLEDQERYGMAVLGQFRDLDDSNRFVWLRSFADMDSRRTALEGFYGGPVWLEHREAANATMIAFDDVLLLRPVDPVSGFEIEGLARQPRVEKSGSGAAATEGPMSAHAGEGSTLTAIDIYPLHPGAEALAPRLADALRVAIEQAGGHIAAALVTEAAENTFPQLPLREGETVLVIVICFAEAAALAAYRDRSVSPTRLSPELARYMAGPPTMLRLAPTSRSLLR